MTKARVCHELEETVARLEALAESIGDSDRPTAFGLGLLLGDQAKRLERLRAALSGETPAAKVTR